MNKVDKYVKALNERDARIGMDESEAITAYKLTRPDCGGWLFAGVTPAEVAETLRNEVAEQAGHAADECGEIHIVAYETTQAEIDALPDWQGW